MGQEDRGKPVVPPPPQDLYKQALLRMRDVDDFVVPSPVRSGRSASLPPVFAKQETRTGHVFVAELCCMPGGMSKNGICVQVFVCLFTVCVYNSVGNVPGTYNRCSFVPQSPTSSFCGRVRNKILEFGEFDF